MPYVLWPEGGARPPRHPQDEECSHSHAGNELRSFLCSPDTTPQRLNAPQAPVRGMQLAPLGEILQRDPGETSRLPG